jgi:hypothetical protein
MIATPGIATSDRYAYLQLYASWRSRFAAKPNVAVHSGDLDDGTTFERPDQERIVFLDSDAH